MLLDGIKMIEFFKVMKKTTGYHFMDKGKRGPYYVYVGSVDNQGRAKTTHSSLVGDEVHEYNFETFKNFFPEMCFWPEENIKDSPVLKHAPGHRYCEVNSTLLYFEFPTSQRAKKFIAEWEWMKEFVDLVNFSSIDTLLRNPLTVWRDPKGYTGKHGKIIQKYFPVEWDEFKALHVRPTANIMEALNSLTFPHWYGEIYQQEGSWKSLRFRTEKEKLLFKMGFIK